MLEKSVDIAYYDPHVDELTVNKISISREENLENLSNFDLILIHTPHSKFQEINFESVASLIFDSTGALQFLMPIDYKSWKILCKMGSISL